MKILLLGLMSLLTINCSKSEFSNAPDIAADEASVLSCHDDDCSSFTVNDNATNPLLQSKTDILFVFDSSGSMAQENRKLASNMDGFIESLDRKGVDFNICHTIADAREFKHSRVKSWSNGQKVINRNTASAAEVFYDSVDSIQEHDGTAIEEPISATYHMLAAELNGDCFRKNVPLEVVFVTDEDEKSCANHCGKIKKFFNKFGFNKRRGKLYSANYPSNLLKLAAKVLKHRSFTVHPIIKLRGFSKCKVNKEESGNFHAALAELTGGTIGDICGGDYAATLDDLSENIQKTLSDIALRCEPSSDIKLTASNGMIFEQEIVKGRLQLTPGVPAGVNVELSYDCAKDQIESVKI